MTLHLIVISTVVGLVAKRTILRSGETCCSARRKKAGFSNSQHDLRCESCCSGRKTEPFNCHYILQSSVILRIAINDTPAIGREVNAPEPYGEGIFTPAASEAGRANLASSTGTFSAA